MIPYLAAILWLLGALLYTLPRLPEYNRPANLVAKALLWPLFAAYLGLYGIYLWFRHTQ